MKNKKNALCGLIFILAVLIYFSAPGQQKQAKGVIPFTGPNKVTRNIIQDRKGNIWIAAYDGIFRYDGKSFTNITSKVSSARFFSVFEDRKGNFWFGSIGAGVYYYNGKSFRNFTTKDGLAGNDVTCIYQDKTGNIWFGTGSGASLYDGKSFQNLKKEAPAHTEADSVHISAYQQKLPESSWMHDDINAIVEDKTGNLWFGTIGYACVYNGKTFTTITNKDGKAFANVRSIIKDKKGNIWLGGMDGLWRFDGNSFINFTRNFAGCVYEDRKGNIWTSSEIANQQDVPLSDFAEKSLSGSLRVNRQWVLSRYDQRSLSDKTPIVSVIKPEAGMLCGILEANDGSIWFGASGGVYRYNGSTITGFKGKVGE